MFLHPNGDYNTIDGICEGQTTWRKRRRDKRRMSEKKRKKNQREEKKNKGETQYYLLKRYKLFRSFSRTKDFTALLGSSYFFVLSLSCCFEKGRNQQSFEEMKSIFGKMGRSKSPHVERPHSGSAIEKSKSASKKGKNKAANEDVAKSKSSKETLPSSEPEPVSAPPRNGLSGPRTSTANEAHMFFDLEEKQKEEAPASLTVEDVCETKEEGFFICIFIVA